MNVKEFIDKIEKGEIDWNNVYDIEVEIDDKALLEKYINDKDLSQHSKKIKINSLYGALDNDYFSLHNRDISGSITFIGRYLIKKTANDIKEKLGKYGIDVHYGDTDSVYFSFDKLARSIEKKYFASKSYDDMNLDEKKKFIDLVIKFIDKYVNPLIDEIVNEILNDFNAYEKGFMGAKVEKVCQNGIFVAKKKYILKTIWDEGKYLIEKPKISMKGIDIIKSQTPDFCQEKLLNIVSIIFEKNENYIKKHIKEIKKEFREIAFKEPMKIAKISGVSSLDYQKDENGYFRIDEETKNRIPCPINSRASIIHNELLDAHNLAQYYDFIEESDKIRFLYLKLPNPIKSDVIGFKEEGILFDLNLVEYIDIETNFDKFFLQPLKLILETIDYEIDENKQSLDDWL